MSNYDDGFARAQRMHDAQEDPNGQADDDDTPSKAEDDRTVDCKYCGKPTRMRVTKMCNLCWELESRIASADVVVLSRILHATGKQGKCNDLKGWVKP